MIGIFKNNILEIVDLVAVMNPIEKFFSSKIEYREIFYVL